MKIIDKRVGQRIRSRRQTLGLSQKKLGDALGLTFQQVQKYETGASRIAASRLFQLAEILDVEVSYFFADLQDSETPDEADPDLGALARAFRAIESEATRASVLRFVKSLAAENGTPGA